MESAKLPTGHFSAKEASRLQRKLGLTNRRMDVLKKEMRQKGNTIPGARAQKAHEEAVHCGQPRIEKVDLLFSDSVHPVQETPVGVIDDMPVFVSNLLDQFERQGRLIWPGKIPKSEIWLKISGDHGGESFKVVLSCLNVDKPNAPDNSVLVLYVEAKDTIENLQKVAEPLNAQIRQLQDMVWKGKSIKLFCCGDYLFLSNLYGISGATGNHPCLWCEAHKDEIQHKAADREHFLPVLRTLENLRQHHDDFERDCGDVRK